MSSNEFYDLKVIWKYLGILLCVCLAMKVSGGTGFLLIIPFVFAALFNNNKVENLVFWMLLINASVDTNSFFMPKNFVYGLTFRVLLLIVGLYGTLLFMSLKNTRLATPLLGVFAYILYMFIPSSQGWAPMISCLKLVLFSSVFMALAYTACKGIENKRLKIRNLRSIFLAFAFFYVFGSVVVYPFPAISSMSYQELLLKGAEVTSLFKGMTSHSQTLGMVMAIWVIFLYCDLIYHIQKPNKLYIALLLCGIFLVFKSSTRTAMGTLIAGVGFSSFYLIGMKGITKAWRGRVISGLLTFCAISALLVLSIPQARNSVFKFAMKYVDEGDAKVFSTEAALKTRSFLVERQLYNFHRKPAIGWGFQVSEEVGEMAKRSEGLMLTAPVEKGVWVTAILEEGGVIGEIIYVTFMICALCALIARKAYMGATMFFILNVSNLGEFTMFSMSGTGGLWYTMIFMALLFDAKRQQGMMGGTNFNMRNYVYSPVGYNPNWR